MAHHYEDGVIYNLHFSTPPTNEHWGEMLETVAANFKSGQLVRMFAKTDNAGPDAKQRDMMNRTVSECGLKVRIAVMTDSLLVRGMATALAWARVVDIRPFRMGEYREALDFLGSDQVDEGRARQVFGTLSHGVR